MKLKPIKVPKWPHQMPYDIFLGLVIHQGIYDILDQQKLLDKFIFEHGYRAYAQCWGKSVVDIRRYYNNAVERYKKLQNDRYNLVDYHDHAVYRQGVDNWRNACGFVYACLCIAYGKTPPKEFQQKAEALVKTILESGITECPPEVKSFFHFPKLKLVTIQTKQPAIC